MSRFAFLSLLAPLALLFACSKSVLVTVPPRVELNRYETLGIIDFATNAERGLGARAARQLQEQVQAAQPGTRFIELAERDAVLAALGATPDRREVRARRGVRRRAELLGADDGGEARRSVEARRRHAYRGQGRRLQSPARDRERRSRMEPLAMFICDRIPAADSTPLLFRRTMSERPGH